MEPTLVGGAWAPPTSGVDCPLTFRGHAALARARVPPRACLSSTATKSRPREVACESRPALVKGDPTMLLIGPVVIAAAAPITPETLTRDLPGLCFAWPPLHAPESCH